MRLFKSKHFARLARRAGISDAELHRALSEVVRGQCDDLGGGVFKKRLNANEHRSIILTVTERGYWVLEFLFAKKDMANIDKAELMAFRKLAKLYGVASDDQIESLLKGGDWVEMTDAPKIQK